MNFPEIYEHRKDHRSHDDQSLLFLLVQLRGQIADFAVTMDKIISIEKSKQDEL